LRNLHEKHGLMTVTVANPLYIEKIKKEFPSLGINASVLCQINSVQKAIFFQNFGCNTLLLDPDINRDLKLLSEIKKSVSCKIRLIANEGCVFQCPCRTFHFNLTSHQSKTKKDIDFFFPMCRSMKSELSNIFKSPWIRPEDLGKYRAITSHFKLTDRKLPAKDMARIARAFMVEEYHGNLLEIIPGLGNQGLTLENDELGRIRFFDKISSCNKRCHECSYCVELSKQLVPAKNQH